MKRNLEICNNSNKYVFTIVSLRIDLSWFIFLKTFLSLFLYCLYRICSGTQREYSSKPLNIALIALLNVF